MPLKAGSPAPQFTARTRAGGTVSLADYRGRKLVLYFYPRDDTPGCTAQACSLRDHRREIAAKGAAILGVSAQDADSHKKFAHKYRLNFPLLADPGRQIARAYDALGSGIAGLLRGLLGVSARVTYVIDEEGRIAHVIANPDCKNHGEEVLKVL